MTRYTTRGRHSPSKSLTSRTMQRHIQEAMLCQVHGGPKLPLPQAEDARATWHDHGVGKLLECLPVWEGHRQICGGQQPRFENEKQEPLRGSCLLLLSIGEEAPTDGSKAATPHHPRLIVLDSTVGSYSWRSHHRILKRQPTTHDYVNLLFFLNFSYHLHHAKNIYLLDE